MEGSLEKGRTNPQQQEIIPVERKPEIQIIDGALDELNRQEEDERNPGKVPHLDSEIIIKRKKADI